MVERFLITTTRVKLSRPGVDVESTDNPGQMLFDSNFNTMKVVQSGTGQLVPDPNATSVSFPTLPQRPYVSALVSLATNQWFVPNEATGGGGSRRFGIFVSTSSFGIRSYDGSTRPFRYTVWYPR